MMNKKLVAALLMVFCSQVVHAGLIRTGDVILDTNTGLNWLEITQTTGLSYNYVNSQFGASGQFAGWGYANLSQMQNLDASYGVSLIQSSFGATGSGTIGGTLRVSTLGMFFDGNAADTLGRGVFNFSRNPGSGPGSPNPSPPTINVTSSISSNFILFSTTYSSSSTGHWLVEAPYAPPPPPPPPEPVPEPNTMLLMALGLGAMRVLKPKKALTKG
ncbi:MAG: hypothetical protein COA96_17360 [SAR86 cluster bacterium]|uniref:Ice-binding protein C-terminal domain-containing protein n=1 Tax=SAR86 cluster bacterium TaxID=2030880 RepID=A0A2A5AF89_9GAMM|nr:MAG: hypothetical protein COA96_17360 [SAR86 cluster bacterium]